MSSIVGSTTRAPVSPPAAPPVGVLLAAGVAVLLRVPTLTAAPIPDEGGFLYLAQHWSRAGGSLYGHYWVDRPPLLIALFRLGGLGDAGGMLGVRLLGCVAAAATVVLLGLVLQRSAGARAAGWGAAVAAVLLAAPQLGGANVNGELLALPFVAAGILCCLRAVEPGARAGSALLAGVAAGAAVMVKQNFVDVAVFGAVLTLALLVADALTWARVLRLGAWFAAGGAGCAAVVLGAAWGFGGTSARVVLFAMYRFRVEAAGPLLRQSAVQRAEHLRQVELAWLFSGGPLLLLLLLAVLVGALVLRRRPDAVPTAGPQQAVVVATLGLAAYALLSILLGGGFWPHYLVQLVPATALAAGLLVVRLPDVGRVVALAVVLATLVTGGDAMTRRAYLPGPAVADSLSRVDRPGDSVVSAFGNPDIAEVAGLGMPYRYPWSLPAVTLDRNRSVLRGVLTGAHAPTWLVVRPQTALALRRDGLGPVIVARYHLVSVVCGRRVLLRDDIARGTPPAPPHCRLPVSPWVYGVLHPSFEGGSDGTASSVSEDRPRSLRLP